MTLAALRVWLAPGKPGTAYLLLALYLTLAIIKTLPLLPDGRFWAEEGAFFFPALLGVSPIDALRYVSPRHDQYFIGVNLFVYLATLVPFRYAPLVTMLLGLLAQIVIVAVLVAYRRQLRLDTLPLAALLIIMVTLPQSSEMWATATNVHWHSQFLIVLLLLITPTSPAASRLIVVLLFISGLSGFSIVFVLPLFLLKALIRCDRHHCWLAGVALLTAVFQLALFLSASSSRGLSVDLLNNGAAVIFQQIVLPALGFDIGYAAATRYQALVSSGSPADLVVLGATLLSAAALYGYLVVKTSALGRWALAGGFLLMAGNSIGALEEGLARLSPWFGGRYYFAANGFFFLVLWSLPRKAVWIKLYLGLVVVVGLLTGLPYRFSGPEWRQALAQASALRLTWVEIWPHGWATPNILVAPDQGYYLIQGAYRSPEQAFAACQRQCFFALIDQSAAGNPQAAGAPALGWMAESGVTLAETTAAQEPLRHRYDDFDIVVEPAAAHITVNGFPVALPAGDVQVMLILADRRQIIVQGFDGLAGQAERLRPPPAPQAAFEDGMRDTIAWARTVI